MNRLQPSSQHDDGSDEEHADKAGAAHANQPDDAEEDQQAREKQATSARVVYRAITQEADDELQRSSAALAWSGLAAGLSMGFSLVAEGLLQRHLPDAQWRPLITKLGYSVGFLIVVLGRQQLFTENTLTPVLPLLRDRCWKTLRNVLRLWGIVLVTNLVGTALFALAAAKTGIFNEETRAAFVALGNETIAPDFGVTLLRGIFAGWLIALMVWLLPVAETGRIGVIIIITYIIGVGEFSHVIAGSAKVFFLAAAGMASWLKALELFILPSLIGNIIGGVALVAALNYAQVSPRGEREGE